MGQQRLYIALFSPPCETQKEYTNSQFFAQIPLIKRPICSLFPPTYSTLLIRVTRALFTAPPYPKKVQLIRLQIVLQWRYGLRTPQSDRA